MKSPTDYYFKVVDLDLYGSLGNKVTVLSFSPKEYTDRTNQWYKDKLDIDDLLPIEFNINQEVDSLFFCDEEFLEKDIVEKLLSFGFEQKTGDVNE